MKKIISIVLLFFALNSFSQSKKEIKITKKQLTESKTLSDFISDLPKDCKIQSYVILFRVGSSLKEYTCITDGIGTEVKDLMCKKEKDSWFFIESIKSTCEKFHKINYKIILE